MARTPAFGVPSPEPSGRVGVWLVVLLVVARGLLLLAPIVCAFVVVTSLVAGAVEDEAWRFALGGVVALAAPIILWWQVSGLVRARHRRKASPLPPTAAMLATRAPEHHGPDAGWFVALANLATAAVLCFGFADDVGRALRRHGDWFVGEERNGAVARAYRSVIARAAGYLEKFDPPPEIAPVIIPADPKLIPYGPLRPGETMPEARPTTLAWFHPLAGPRRALPWSESRRFGAARPQPRPTECELGHCGVDLGSTVGEPVFACFDGVIERIEREEDKGGRAGRYIRIGHKEGTVVTRYIHLDSVRVDLKEGDHVKAGELIARLGHSGIEHSGPHLHFGLSLRPHGRGGDEKYIDPEPLLRTWQLPDATHLPTTTFAFR